MSLLLLAYPEMAKDDLERIQAYRKQYDLQYSFAEPHFTIVFAIDDIPTAEFVAEVRKQSEGIRQIAFTVHEAILNKNDFHLLYHSFLVPGDGYEDIVSLHDKMYSGLFLSHLHPTIAYVPHITIGSAIDETIGEKVVGIWDEHAVPMTGRITALDIVQYENGTLNTLEKIALH